MNRQDRHYGARLDQNDFWPQFSTSCVHPFPDDLRRKQVVEWLAQNVRSPWALHTHRTNAFRVDLAVYIECGPDRDAFMKRWGNAFLYTPSSANDLERIAVARGVLPPRTADDCFLLWEEKHGKNGSIGKIDTESGQLRLTVSDAGTAAALAAHPKWGKIWMRDLDKENDFVAGEYPIPSVRPIPAAFAAYLETGQKPSADALQPRIVPEVVVSHPHHPRRYPARRAPLVDRSIAA